MYFFRPLYLVALSLFLLLYFFSHSYLLSRRYVDDPRTFSSMASWQISPTVLNLLAGEFKGLVSDILILEIGAAMGDQIIKKSDGTWERVKKEYDWKQILHMVKLCQSMDPHFSQPLYLVQGWLPWYGYVKEANQFHREFARLNPWDWRPYHFIGFNMYFFLHDFTAAGRAMLEGASIPSAPPFLALLGARLSQKGDDVEAAIVLLKTILAGKKDTDFDYEEIHNRYEALKGVLVINRAVAQYKSVHGKAPENLQQLLESRILPSLPPNPYKLNYCLDAQGNVQYDNPKCQ